MNLRERIELLVQLGDYLLSNEAEWEEAKRKAYAENRWFIPEFIELSVHNITRNFLQSYQLEQWIDCYHIPDENLHPKKIGIVMAGNIPLAGFHDLLCVFLSGHYALVKLSSKDAVLIKQVIKKLIEWNREVEQYIGIGEMIRNCDAYIATGSNNSARYFEYYFSKYPHIIRRNRTSVAILTGEETPEELTSLADDVYQFFGLSCRNVTKLYVPEGYNFIPLLDAFSKYDYLSDNHKYRNNYDYMLAVLILNKQYYMTNQSILLNENKELFSPISQLNFEYYKSTERPADTLKNNPDVQCLVGKGHLPFGRAQQPSLTDYADGVDVMKFLLEC